MEKARVYFRKFLSKELPGFSTFLDEGQVNELYHLYADWEEHKRIAADCLSKQLNRVAKVDYTGDFEKEMSIAALKGIRLQNAIEKIKKVYGLNDIEDSKEEKVFA